jgi:glycosyltransferase involved in cell wall biosynthesis
VRVALVGDEYYPDIGGASHYAFELSRHLVKLGIETVVITHWHPGQPEEEQFASVKVKRVRGLVLKDPHRAVSPLVFRRCHRYIHDERFDVVHGLDFYSSMAQMAIHYAHRCSIPCVLTCHTICNSPPLIGIQRPMGLALRKANRLIAVSQASARYSHLLGFRKQRIVVVPNGVDLSCFSPRTDGTHVRDALGIGSEPLVVTALRLIKRKSPDLLVSAFARVLRVIPNAKLVIAGSGREKDRLMRLAERLNMNNSVLLAGQLEREKVAQLMAAADVFVLPSAIESFGMALLEASAVGIPVVCSDAGGVPEVFQHELNALLYPPGDDTAIARAIIRLLRDKELARMITANAMQTASTLTWELAAQRTLQVYEQVLQESQ